MLGQIWPSIGSTCRWEPRADPERGSELNFDGLLNFTFNVKKFRVSSGKNKFLKTPSPLCIRHQEYFLLFFYFHSSVSYTLTNANVSLIAAVKPDAFTFHIVNVLYLDKYLRLH